MVQVVKRVKIKGEVHESIMSFTDQEWFLIQQHYPFGGVSFELKAEKSQIADKAGRSVDDDKPNMKDYNVVKDMAMEYFKQENWDKALYYFERAYELKSHAWLVGKITKCKQYAENGKK